VIPSAPVRYAIATQPLNINKSELTPFEVAMAEDDDGRINRVAYGAACVIEASAENFGTPLPTAEEVYHRRKVAEVAEEIAGGRFSQVCLTDGPEEKRIRRLAEEIVREQEARIISAPASRKRHCLDRKKQAAFGPLGADN
jgi:hypothetical protein